MNMKIIITILVTITGLVALPNKAEARPYSHSGSSYTYRSGHASCGCAIYTKRILSGYDHCRQPIYRYCGVPIVHRCHSKRSHYSSSYGHQSGHYNHRSRYNNYSSSRYGHSRYSSRHGSHYGFRTSIGSIRICR